MLISFSEFVRITLQISNKFPNYPNIFKKILENY